jgi:hypothetical protein
MEDLQEELDNLFQAASATNQLLPVGDTGDRMLPEIRREFRWMAGTMRMRLSLSQIFRV